MKGEGVASSLRPLRLQPTLHNLTGTLCVAVEFLGRKKLQLKKKKEKEKRFNTASNKEQKICPFLFRKLYKNYKKKNATKKPKRFSSNRYCLFTSHKDSLHLAAHMKHFSTPDNIESTLAFFWVIVWLCWSDFFVFFVAFYAKGREASNNLYTVYTANYTSLTYVPLHPSASYQNVRTPFKKRKPLLCLHKQSRPCGGNPNHTEQNK